ncbi:Hypothetical protein CINCED_3A008907 [Cinara cedri]|uniref:Uncharacterized protein n=1 Tax=Cinara cedri TaxID=506608 RepID=A0A5E4NN44_9HEMI|nr:Hypothetical protein CINCED_3A008907 [Cinara cedri]
MSLCDPERGKKKSRNGNDSDQTSNTHDDPVRSYRPPGNFGSGIFDVVNRFDVVRYEGPYIKIVYCGFPIRYRLNRKYTKRSAAKMTETTYSSEPQRDNVRESNVPVLRHHRTDTVVYGDVDTCVEVIVAPEPLNGCTADGNRSDKRRRKKKKNLRIHRPGAGNRCRAVVGETVDPGNVTFTELTGVSRWSPKRNEMSKTVESPRDTPYASRRGDGVYGRV